VSSFDIADFLPQKPEWHLDWSAIDQAFPWIRKLRGSTQDAIHHAEGDVWIHTRMVVQALIDSQGWRELPAGRRLELFAAALLHDVCKPETRRQEGERITNRGHSRAGANEARQILWRMGWDFSARERVCTAIAVHQVPFWIIDDKPWKLTRALVEVSLNCGNDFLYHLSLADAKGRICRDQSKLLDNVELFKEAAVEEGCFDYPYQFSGDFARIAYFNDPERKRPDIILHDTTSSDFVVTCLVGLPGSGKSTWAKAAAGSDLRFLGQEIVSLDHIRGELDIDPEDSDAQGRVIQFAKEEVRKRLRLKQSFIYDATNLSRQFREPLLALFMAYGARTRVVYIESLASEHASRNEDRGRSAVPRSAVERMMRKWEPPTAAECHDLEFLVPEPLTCEDLHGIGAKR
jgi:putative nucleotidyltransferase with HDIG domain